MGFIFPALVAVAASALAVVFVKKPSSIDPFHSAYDVEQTMRAIAYNSHSEDPSALQLNESFPRPALQKNQVMIKVTASAINPVDFKFRRNALPNFIIPKPKIPGLDVSGVIVDVGDRINTLKPGQRVVSMLPLLMTPWGGLCEYVAVDASLVARVGEDVNLQDAASFPLVALTVVQAFQYLKDEDLNGKKILIQAGGGGVGTFAIQYAKYMGMHVATTASKSKSEFLKSLGADEVIDYHTTKFEDVIQDYDVVLDPMSWAYENRTLSSGVLKPSGYYLSIASSDWKLDNKGKEKTNSINSLLARVYHNTKNWLRPGSTPRYGMVLVQPNGQMLQNVMDLVANKTLKAVIDRQFPLTDAVSAFEYLESGHAAGKVVITLN